MSFPVLTYTKTMHFNIFNYELLPNAASLLGETVEDAADTIYNLCKAGVCNVELLQRGLPINCCIDTDYFRCCGDGTQTLKHSLAIYNHYLKHAKLNNEVFKENDFFIICNDDELLPIKQIKWYSAIKEYYNEDDIYDLIVKNRKQNIDADDARNSVMLSSVLSKTADPLLYSTIEGKIKKALQRGEV